MSAELSTAMTPLHWPLQQLGAFMQMPGASLIQRLIVSAGVHRTADQLLPHMPDDASSSFAVSGTSARTLTGYAYDTNAQSLDVSGYSIAG